MNPNSLTQKRKLIYELPYEIMQLKEDIEESLIKIKQMKKRLRLLRFKESRIKEVK